MVEKNLDAHAKHKKFNLEELFPGMCLPVKDNQEAFDVDELDSHD